MSSETDLPTRCTPYLDVELKDGKVDQLETAKGLLDHLRSRAF